jgi:hypothetical protein
MTGNRVLADQTVIIEGNRIIAIGPRASTPVPGGATVVDARGKYLMPGLAEMHAHVPGRQASDADMERVMHLFLAHGITTIRGMLGAPRHLELRGKLERGEVVGPRLFTTGPSLNGNSVGDWATARRLVEEQQRAGYDLLKIHPGIPREAFDTLAATAKRVNIRFAGHVPLDVGLERALAAPFWSIDHLDGYAEAMAVVPGGGSLPASQFFGANLAAWLDTTRVAALAARTRAAGVWNVPTQVLFENLEAGTTNVARYLGREGEMGTVQPGKRADLILLEANPLEEVGNTQKIVGVMVNGRWMDRTALDALLRPAQQGG